MKSYNSKNRTTNSSSNSSNSTQSQQQVHQKQRSSLGLSYSYYYRPPNSAQSTRRIHPAQIRVVQEVFQAQAEQLLPRRGVGSYPNPKKQQRKQQQQQQQQRQLEQQDTTSTTNSNIPPTCQLPLTSCSVWTSSKNPLTTTTSTTNIGTSQDTIRNKYPQPPQTHQFYLQQQQLRHHRHRLQHRQSSHPYHQYYSNHNSQQHQRLIIDTTCSGEDHEVIELIRLASSSTLVSDSSEVNSSKMGLPQDASAMGDTALVPPPSLPSSSSPSMLDNILSSFSFGGNDATTTNEPVPSSTSQPNHEGDEEGQEALWLDHSANGDDYNDGDGDNRSCTSATMNSSSPDVSPIGAKGPFGRTSKKGTGSTNQQQQQQPPRGLSFFRNKLKLPSPSRQPHDDDDADERQQQGTTANGSTKKFLSLSPNRSQKVQSSKKKDFSHQIVLLPATGTNSSRKTTTTESNEQAISMDSKKRSVTFQTPERAMTDYQQDSTLKESSGVALSTSVPTSSSSTTPNDTKLLKKATDSTATSTSQSGDTSTTDYQDHPLVSSSAPSPTSSSSKSSSPPSSPTSSASSSALDKEKLKQAHEKAFTARRLLDRALSGDSASFSSSFFGGTNRKQLAQSAFTHATEARQLIGFNTNNNSDQDVSNTKVALQKQLKEASAMGQAAVKKAQLQLQQQKNEKTTENEDYAGRARHYLEIILGDVDELVHKELGILQSTSKNGAGEELSSAPTNAMSQDVSTLGFDNTFEVQSTATKNIDSGRTLSPGRRGDTPKGRKSNLDATAKTSSPEYGSNELDILSMSSLNEILDGPIESPEKLIKDTTPPSSPSKDNDQEDVVPEATTFVNVAVDSAPDITANKSKDKSKKSGGIFASVFRGKSAASGKKDKAILGAAAVVTGAAASTVAANVTRSPSTSPSRIGTKQKPIQRFIASSIVEDDDEAPQPTVYDRMRMHDEEIASTIEERLQERLQAAFNNDAHDDGSLASLDGIKFHTREQMEKEKELLEQKIYLGIRASNSRGIEEQQQLPIRRRLIPQILPSFVAAPKGDPGILTQKSWESLTENETVDDRVRRSVALSAKYDKDDNKDPEDVSSPKIQALTPADDDSFDSDGINNIASATDRYAVASPTNEENKPEVVARDKYSSLLADPCSFCDSFWISSTSEHKNPPLELSISQDHSPSSAAATSLLSFASFSPTKAAEPTKGDDAATIRTEADEDEDANVKEQVPTEEPLRSTSRLVKDLPIDDDEDDDEDDETKATSKLAINSADALVTDVCVPVGDSSLCDAPTKGGTFIETGVEAPVTSKPPVAKKMSLRQFFVKKNSGSKLTASNTPKNLPTEADGDIPPFCLALGPPSPAVGPMIDDATNDDGVEQENPTVEKIEDKFKSTTKRGFIFASKKNVIKSSAGEVKDTSQTVKVESARTLSNLNNSKTEQKPAAKKKSSFFMTGKKFNKNGTSYKETIPPSGDSENTNTNDVSIDPVDTDESGSAASHENDPAAPEPSVRPTATTTTVEEVTI